MRLSYEIFSLLVEITSRSREGLYSETASEIFTLILSYSPSLTNKKARTKATEIAKQCIQIGNNIAYDSFVHLKALNIARWGLTIVKYVYREAKHNNMAKLKKEVLTVYKNLDSTLQRTDRNDLALAHRMLIEYKKDLDIWDLAFPVMPKEIEEKITAH